MESHSPDPAVGPDASRTAPPDEPAPLRVRIYSDVVCPWCYIGKRRFEAALALPEAPPVGGSVTEAYAKKFGGEARATQIIAQVTEAAAAEGLGFRLDRAVRSNTFDSHRLLWWADQEDRAVGGEPADGVLPNGLLDGCQSALKESLLAAYFVEGLDVSDHRVLVARAAAVGLDADEATEVLASGAGVSEVRSEIAGAVSADVTAVPTFVLDGRQAIPGAQDPATIAHHLGRIGAPRDR